MPSREEMEVHLGPLKFNITLLFVIFKFEGLFKEQRVLQQCHSSHVPILRVHAYHIIQVNWMINDTQTPHDQMPMRKLQDLPSQ